VQAKKILRRWYKWYGRYRIIAGAIAFNMNSHYRIGKFAELGGVSTKTLRFYDEIGVLRPASVESRTGYRRYLPQQLEDLAAILALKNLGVSLAKIRDLTTKKAVDADRKAMLNELKRTMERSVQAATQSLKWINAALDDLCEHRPPISVVVKRRPAIPIASLRVKLEDYAQISHFEQELSNSLPAECLGSLRGVLWHRCADSGSLEAEPFVGLKKRVPGRLPFTLRQLPEATLACAYSTDDEESAEQAYQGIRRWMGVRGYRLAGPKRELYLGQMLEIQFPLAES
jgi:DNA-binding transcriptional MerR regulator